VLRSVEEGRCSAALGGRAKVQCCAEWHSGGAWLCSVDECICRGFATLSGRLDVRSVEKCTVHGRLAGIFEPETVAASRLSIVPLAVKL
jgi:hypothetical protein